MGRGPGPATGRTAPAPRCPTYRSWRGTGGCAGSSWPAAAGPAARAPPTSGFTPAKSTNDPATAMSASTGIVNLARLDWSHCPGTEILRRRVPVIRLVQGRIEGLLFAQDIDAPQHELRKFLTDFNGCIIASGAVIGVAAPHFQNDSHHRLLHSACPAASCVIRGLSLCCKFECARKVRGNFQEIEPFSSGIRMRRSLRALPIHLRNVCLFPLTRTGEHASPRNGEIDFR